MAFLIDGSVDITPEKIEQDTDEKEKLKQFKDEVKSGRVVRWCTNRDDLANEIAIDLTKEVNRGRRSGWIGAID